VTGMAFVDWLQNDTLGLLLLAAVSVAVLLVLIIKVKLEPFIALLIVGILTALAGGVSVADLVGSATGASESILEKGYAGRWGTSPSSSASAPCSARCWSPPGRPRCCWPG
jgi:GntP family gluconate:H+ symporter